MEQTKESSSRTSQHTSEVTVQTGKRTCSEVATRGGVKKTHPPRKRRRRTKTTHTANDAPPLTRADETTPVVVPIVPVESAGLTLGFRPRKLPTHLHRHARVILRMLTDRKYNVDMSDEDAYAQATACSYVDAVGPRFGKMRVVFFHSTNALEATSSSGAICDGAVNGAGHPDSLATQPIVTGASSGASSYDTRVRSSIGVDDIDALLEMTQHFDIKHIMLILDTDVSYVARGELVDSGLHWERFLYDEVSYNLVDHEWVPKHQLLTARERREKLRRDDDNASASRKFRLCGSVGSVSENLDNPCTLDACFCLPRLLTSYPVARYYDYQHGDMVRITADSTTAGTHFKYRVVMNNSSLQ